MKVMKTIYFPYPIKAVWEKVTSLSDTAWRSDLNKVEVIIPEKEFIEIDRTNIQTTFKITAKKELEYYAFTLENKNLKGTWQGIFKEENNQTCLLLIEEVNPKINIPKWMVKCFLRHSQKTYCNDLKKSLK